MAQGGIPGERVACFGIGIAEHGALFTVDPVSGPIRAVGAGGRLEFSLKQSSNKAVLASPDGDAEVPSAGWRRGSAYAMRDARGGDSGWQGSAACEKCGRLASRERWIVNQVMKNKAAPNKVLASALKISPNTLRNHLASIYGKLGVRRRVELVMYAMEHGLDGPAHV